MRMLRFIRNRNAKQVVILILLGVCINLKSFALYPSTRISDQSKIEPEGVRQFLNAGVQFRVFLKTKTKIAQVDVQELQLTMI